MKTTAALGASIALVTVTVAAFATELPVSDTELRNVGAEFVLPGPAGPAGAVEARGRVIIPPSAEHVISSTQPGLVLRLHAAAGDPVNAGQVLAEVRSPAFLSLQQEYLEASHDNALAEAQLRRDAQLAEEGIISERRFEETRAIAGAAAGRRAEHRQILRLAGMPETAIDALESNQRFRDTLEVRSPIDGVVLELLAKSGESVESVQALYRVANLSELWIDILVPQEQVNLVTPGMLVDVADCNVDLPARVTAIGRAVDAGTQTVSVRAELRGSDHGLKPGQLVAVRIVAPDLQRAADPMVSVPVAAIVRRGTLAFVFVRVPGGVEPRRVDIAGSADGNAYIRGVGVTDEIAVRGIAALKAMWLVNEDDNT